MADDSGLRPLYLLLFAAGFGVLVSLALNVWADAETGAGLPDHVEPSTVLITPT